MPINVGYWSLFTLKTNVDSTLGYGQRNNVDSPFTVTQKKIEI